MTNRC